MGVRFPLPAPFIPFIFNSFARNGGYPLDISGYKIGYSAHLVYFQYVEISEFTSRHRHVYVVSVLYAQLRNAQRIIGPLEAGFAGSFLTAMPTRKSRSKRRKIKPRKHRVNPLSLRAAAATLQHTEPARRRQLWRDSVVRYAKLTTRPCGSHSVVVNEFVAITHLLKAGRARRHRTDEKNVPLVAKQNRSAWIIS